MLRLALLTGFAFSFLPGPARSQQLVSPDMAECKEQFAGPPPSIVTGGKIDVRFGVSVSHVKNYYICFSQYGVLNSSVTKTPLWSAENLTPERVRQAKALHRENKFHSEKLIADKGDRASLSDYLGSKKDRGHMSPDDDMGDMDAQFESFSLANMVPQHPCNNEIIWKAIETSVRNYVMAHGNVYVVTGPIFDDMSLTIGNGVHVPTRLFKAVYDPRTNAVVVVVTENKNVQTYTTATLDQVRDWTGLDLFPGVSNFSSLALPPLANLTGACAKDN